MTARGTRLAGPPSAPRLRLRSHFEPVMVLYHHPVRLTVSLLLPLMLLPELAAVVRALFGVTGTLAQFIVVMAVVFLVFLPQFLSSALDCSRIHYDFHDDHLSFTESFLLRDRVRVPYRFVHEVRVRRNLLQRRFRLADIEIVTHTGAGRMDPREEIYRIPDVRDAFALRRRIEAVVSAYKASAAASAKDRR